MPSTNINQKFRMSIDTPWKAVNEIFMYITTFLVYFYLHISGVKIGKNCRFYGFPMIVKNRGGKIVIGDDFECRSSFFSNPLGINHPAIICAWNKDAVVKIGNNVGMSGGSIVANKLIEIGDGTIIGANSTIIDTDFHPVRSENRRYDRDNVKSYPVFIGKNVFIGLNSIILKGSTIRDDSIVPAGNIVRK